MVDPPAADPLELARAVQPQEFGSTAADRIREPIVEPLWPGLRLIGAVLGEDAVLVAGGEVLTGHDDVRTRLARMLAATTDGAVVDGYLTKQVVLADEVGGAYGGPEVLPSTGRMVVQSMVGTRRNRSEEAARRLEAATAERTFAEDEQVNLVITDLLWLDGQWLLDVPLLERKRLLEAIVTGDDLVRAGPYVRPPVSTWIGSWRAQGFAGITFKEANSRYRPGEKATDWTSAEMPRR